jgi:hypothetical protein
MAGMKGRLKRVVDEADGIIIRQMDGSIRLFDRMQIQQELYLAGLDVELGRPIGHSPVLDAYLGATPESRAAFEREFVRSDPGKFADVRRVLEILDGADYEPIEIPDLSEAE